MALAFRRLGLSSRSVVMYRRALALLLVLDTLDRMRTLRFLYSDEGSLPRWAVLPPLAEAPLLRLVCVHGWSGWLGWQRALSAVQLACALGFGFGFAPRACGLSAWLLHVSVSLRNPSLIYILDRYIHVLLVCALCLPSKQLAEVTAGERARTCFVCSPASLMMAVQLVAIYADAGLGKLRDPEGAWQLDAQVPALDTYLRHTPAGALVRQLLGVRLLRLAGPLTAYTELLAAPLMLCCGEARSRRLLVLVGCALHAAIALCMRNTALLSLAAVTLWLPFWDVQPPQAGARAKRGSDGTSRDAPGAHRADACAHVLVVAFALAVGLYQAHGGQGPGCGGRVGSAAVHRLLLHNRWNVFTGAEGYVVWEIAPARLRNGSVVDLWRGGGRIAWEVPYEAAERHSGRWRAWPYMAERSPSADAAFWGALCREWDVHIGESRAAASSDPLIGAASGSAAVVGYHFYMMQADIVPGGDYGQPRKRLVRSFSCIDAPLSSI